MNGDLTEYVADHLNGRTWNAYDLTQIAGAPTLAGDPAAVLNGTVYVHGRAANGDVIEYVPDFAAGRSWSAYDLTRAAGVTTDPSTINLNGTVHIYG